MLISDTIVLILYLSKIPISEIRNQKVHQTYSGRLVNAVF